MVVVFIVNIITLQLVETFQRQRRPAKTSHSIKLCSEQPKNVSTYVAFEERHKAFRR